MMEFLKAILGFVLELTIFFCIGSLLMRKMKLKAEASLALVLGYLLYFSVFEFLTVPLTLAWVPLHTLCLIWGIILAVVVCLSIFFQSKPWIQQLKGIGGIPKSHGLLLLLVAGVILLQCAIVVLYEDTTVDAAYYVGTVSTSVYTDTLGRYNPYTGLLYKDFPARYILSAYPMHNAVWCRFLDIHPIIQAKIIMPVIHVLVANFIIYHIGKRLFHGGRKQADLMTCLVCLMQLFSYTIYTPGTFFFTRSYEGKSLLGNVIFPVVLYCSIWFWQKAKDYRPWLVLFLASASGAAFSGSSLIFPVAVSAGILPTLLFKKRFRALFPYILCMLPTILYAAVYFSQRLGWLTLSAS